MLRKVILVDGINHLFRPLLIVVLRLKQQVPSQNLLKLAPKGQMLDRDVSTAKTRALKTKIDIVTNAMNVNNIVAVLI